ncbi:unnamed protein product [Arctogadus glacialis]
MLKAIPAWPTEASTRRLHGNPKGSGVTGKGSAHSQGLARGDRCARGRCRRPQVNANPFVFTSWRLALK